MKTNQLKIVLAVLSVSTIISCNVSKDTVLPTNALPESYRGTNVTTDSSSIADISWKNFYTDVALQTLIDSAITRNNDLQIAIKNIEIAQKKYTQSKWNNVPRLDLAISASTTNPSDNSFTGKNLGQALGQQHLDDYSTSLSLSWEADIWGKIKNQNKEAFVSYLQSAEVSKAVKTTLVADVSKGYYNLLMLDSQLAIAKKNVQLNDSTTTIIKLQYNSGLVSSLAIQQSEALQLNAQQLVPKLEQNIAIQENALSVLTGDFPNSKVRTASINNIQIKDSLAVGIPSSLVQRRPDVHSAELALQIANARVGISKANLYPTLKITAQGGLNSFESSNWFNMPASLFGTALGGLTQPLLNNKKLRTNYKIAIIERDKAVIQFRQAVLIAVSEVADALVKLDKLQEQIDFLQQRVTILNKATFNANLLFKNGMADYLEVLTAQANVLQAELELANLKREQLSNNTELYKALGGGWQ
ncbi:MAG: efflux transporter outer membrane subunit [Bacteroidetes bacterium]|nr:efflux transporter outer membrane subunit [Bacteroidota bacterium]